MTALDPTPAADYIAEDGVKPNVAYRCDSTGRLVEVTS